MSKLYICEQFFILSYKPENEGGFHFILALAIMLEALSFSERKLNGKFDVRQKVPHLHNNTVFIMVYLGKNFLL
jgi:hypothetical protein